MAWRYDVVGFLGGDFGLAVAARNSIRALEASGRMGAAIPIEVRAPATPKVRLLEMLGLRKPVAVPPPAPPPPGSGDAGERVALFQVNPLEIAWYSGQWRDVLAPGSRNVCVPFWELPLVPRSWEPMLRAMDAVLAPTRFVQSACARVLPEGRVLHYPQAVFLPTGVRPDRDAWGIAGARTVFVVAFDPGSDVDRKNPWGALEAFRQAFPADPEVALVVKTKPWPHVPEYVAQAEELRARVAGDRRVRIVDRSLSYAEVLSLYASCDVMVSLHRSEGLGLHLMEAMSLGRVVVATGWSGNVDFMTPANSVPVGYRMVPVRTRHGHYRPEMGRSGQEWAEADVAEAAEAMRALHRDPARRATLGGAAQSEMEARRRAHLEANAFRSLEAHLHGTAPLPAALRRAVARTRFHALVRELVREARTRLQPRSTTSP